MLTLQIAHRRYCWALDNLWVTLYLETFSTIAAVLNPTSTINPKASTLRLWGDKPGKQNCTKT